jgi:flavodoxin
MANALIVYFSLTGRTEYIAEQLAHELSNYQVRLEPIKFTGSRKSYMNNLSSSMQFDETKLLIPTEISDLTPYDLICIGMPIHGGRPAFIFDHYMQKSKGWEGKQVIIFATGRISPYQALPLMKSAIEQKGGKIVAEFVIKRFFSVKHVSLKPFIAEFLQNQEKK